MSETVVNGWRLRGSKAGAAARWLSILVVLIGGRSTSSLSKGAQDSPERQTAVVKKNTACEVYFLQNQDPVSLAEALGKLVCEPGGDREGREQAGRANSQERIVVVPEKVTHSVIVRADREDQEWIATLIRQLDKNRPRVLIDCTLVEVTRSDFFDSDLSSVRQSPALGHTSPMAAEPNEYLSAFYDDHQIQALVVALQSRGYGRVLARPMLLANDHQKVTMETKETTYAKGPSGTYTPYETGLMLDFTPHIGAGVVLQLDVALAQSDFRKETWGRPPGTRFNKVEASVRMPNSSTVILLGGMLKLNGNRTGSRVPVLGDVPLVGGLFRSKDAQSKLYLFVKAQVIRPVDIMKDLEALSQKNREAFERRELEFQAMQEWPGLGLKRVAPGKLDEDR